MVVNDFDKKRERQLFKKAVAVMLTVLFGLSPALPIFECGEVRAAANSNLAREVWQTREELADGTYNTSESGQTGYIIFGTRPEVKYEAAGGNEATASAGPIKWLIIGQDTEGTLELYSEEPLMSANEYDSSSIFDPDVGYTYKKTDDTYGEVYVNHYGASNFRKNLQSIAGNTSYFKSAEQGLMLSTAVKTQDTLNHSEYETEDKLYGLYAENLESYYKDIYAGENNSLPVNIKYWKAPHWLRSPYPRSSRDALFAVPGSYVDSLNVDGTGPAVVAASKLNLSSLIFSSAARSAKTTATAIGGENLAAYANTYNLRLEDPSITGGISRNTDYTEITAKVPTGGTYYLMVQGIADDGTNYAYSKEISSGTATIKTSDITTTSVSSFEGAKAWVEKASADSDGQLLYAVALTTIAPETPVTPETPYAPTETPGEVDKNIETIEEEENALNTVKTSDMLTNFTLSGLALVATFASLGLVLTSKMSKKKSDE